jgi:hypothetical protein
VSGTTTNARLDEELQFEEHVRQAIADLRELTLDVEGGLWSRKPMDDIMESLKLAVGMMNWAAVRALDARVRFLRDELTTTLETFMELDGETGRLALDEVVDRVAEIVNAVDVVALEDEQ